MTSKTTVQRSFALLKWLPVVAAAAFVFDAGSKASAQSTPSTIGYVVSGCDITTDNGVYNIVGTDIDGNPYYKNVAGAYLEADGDDQEGRDYYRWYIGTDPHPFWNGLFDGLYNDDYMTGNAGDDDWYYNSHGQPTAPLVDAGPATGGSIWWQGDDAGNSYPTVVSE